MHELDDNALLREFAERGSERAFAELVARHVNKVYSVALRHTRNPHSAEEITQAVFVILAQKADKLHRDVVLSGWLYQTARLTAVTLIRSDIRRARREQEVLMQTSPNESESDVWPHIAPLLDDAMARLSEADRHAVVLRYFDGKSLKEVGAALGGSEDAAKMRVNRAVEKLRKFFTKRGVTTSAAVLTATISANSVQAAPVALAKTVTAVAVVKGSSATTSTLTLVKGTLKLMAWTKVKPFIAVGVAVVLAAGTKITVAQNQLHINSTKMQTHEIPYKLMDAAFQFSDIAGVDKTKVNCLVVVMVNNKVARPEDINLTIQSAAKGTIPLQLGTSGEILNFPRDEVLRRENPNIIVNINGDTFTLALKRNVPLPESLTFPYRRLGDAVAEANKLIKYINEHTPSKDHQQLVQGFYFNFPKSSAGKATLVIAAASGKREYLAKASGNYLKLDQRLLKENPDVTVSEMPLSISLY